MKTAQLCDNYDNREVRGELEFLDVIQSSLSVAGVWALQRLDDEADN